MKKVIKSDVFILHPKKYNTNAEDIDKFHMYY